MVSVRSSLAHFFTSVTENSSFTVLQDCLFCEYGNKQSETFWLEQHTVPFCLTKPISYNFKQTLDEADDVPLVSGFVSTWFSSDFIDNCFFFSGIQSNMFHNVSKTSNWTRAMRKRRRKKLLSCSSFKQTKQLRRQEGSLDSDKPSKASSCYMFSFYYLE